MAEPRRIVTNTGPLIALAGIGRLELLNALYDDVQVPEQVHHEVFRAVPVVESCLHIIAPTF